MPDPSIWTTQEVASSAYRCANMEVICKEAEALPALPARNLRALEQAVVPGRHRSSSEESKISLCLPWPLPPLWVCPDTRIPKKPEPADVSAASLSGPCLCVFLQLPNLLHDYSELCLCRDMYIASYRRTNGCTWAKTSFSSYIRSFDASERSRLTSHL